MALWEAWEGFWEIIGAKKKEQRATTYAICDGDLCDFNRYSQAQLISQRREDVLMALHDVAEPILKVADHIFVIRGTASHTEGTGGVEDIFAAEIGAERTEDGSASWWVLRAELGGVRFDATHHPPTYSRRPWTRTSSAERAAAILAANYLKEDKAADVPKVALWAHVHFSAEGHGLGVHGFFLPPFKLVGEFGHRLGTGAHIEKVGGLWLLCHEGRVLDWDWELWAPKEIPIWRNTR